MEIDKNNDDKELSKSNIHGQLGPTAPKRMPVEEKPPLQSANRYSALSSEEDDEEDSDNWHEGSLKTMENTEEQKGLTKEENHSATLKNNKSNVPRNSDKQKTKSITLITAVRRRNG